jgi:hypothetical protein
VVPRAGLEAVEEREIPNPSRESNPRTPIVQSVKRYKATDVLYVSELLAFITSCLIVYFSIIKYKFNGRCFSQKETSSMF